MSDNFPNNFIKEYQSIYSYRKLEPIIILLFIIFMVIYALCVYFKIN